MFADNEKISSRQCMRLLFFDIIGIGSLVLPQRLAAICGTDGVAAILFGALAGGGYLFLLGRAAAIMKGDFLEFVQEKYGKAFMKILGVLYGGYYLILGSYALHLFSSLMMQALLKEESYWLIALLGLLLAGYGMCRGLECRSRVFEILFWFVVIPLVLMLALGAVDVQWQNVLPMGVANPASLLMGGYLVFLVFSLNQMLIHLGSAVSVKEGYRAAAVASWLAVGVFVFLYLVLLGVFGAGAVSALDYPAVSLMSTVAIPGGFLRRQDAIMVGIWFFSLFALICSSLYYCCKSSQRVLPFTGKKKTAGALFLMAAMFALAWACYLMPEAEWLAERFFLVSTPFYLVCPLILVLPKRCRKQALGMVVAVLAAAGLCGCSVQELENRSFPLAVGIGVDEGACRLMYKFQDLSEISSKQDTTKGSEEQEVTASGVYPAMTAYERENGKVMDLNHVKVVIFEQSFLENAPLYEDFVAYMKQSQDISWNVLLFVTEDIGTVLSLQDEMGMPVGTYLEEMMEGNRQLDEKSLVTLGSLLNDESNQRKNLWIPYLVAGDGLPVQDGFYGICKGEPVGRIPEEQGNLANIFTGTTVQLELNPKQGCNVMLEDFDVSYALGEDGNCAVTVRAIANCYGSGTVTEKELEDFLNQKFTSYFADNLRQTGRDFTASYDDLPLYAPQAARQFAGDWKAYEKQLRLSFATDISMVRER